MKDSYLTAGIKLDQLFRLLRRNQITYSPATIYRLAFLVQSACWSSIFSWIEKARYTKALKNTPAPIDPIFIIGHWRTGSTYLHQLMNLDPELCTPSLFEVAVPDSFLVSYPYYRPIFKQVVSEHRPMDQVKIGMDEPQEDEYAIYRMTNFSPLENLVFPKSNGYFLNHGSSFLPGGDQLIQWKKVVKEYYKKLSFRNKKRIVSKNPFNSFRITELHEMFPEAKFIHIVRHPYCVVPSTIHMWNILRKQNALNNNGAVPGFSEVVGVLRNLLETVEKDRAGLPPGSMVQIRFEDLEASPVEVLRSAYREIGLPFSEKLKEEILSFMAKNDTFRKNSFSLTAEEKAIIARELDFQFVACSYDQDC